MPEVLAASKNPAQQNSCIHRRHFGVEHALSGFGVGEMVEKSAVIGQFLPQKAQGGEDALQRIGGGDEVSLGSKAKSSKSQCGGSKGGARSLSGRWKRSAHA